MCVCGYTYIHIFRDKYAAFESVNASPGSDFPTSRGTQPALGDQEGCCGMNLFLPASGAAVLPDRLSRRALSQASQLPCAPQEDDTHCPRTRTAREML